MSFAQQPPKQPESPRGLAGTELTAVAVLAKVHPVVARIKVLPPTARHCLDLQRRELQVGGVGGAD